MTGMERILATLTGKPLDRRPFAPVLSLYGARLIGCPLEAYYTDPAAFARGQSAVLETFHPDVLFSPFNFPAIGAAFGSELHYFGDQAPNIRRPVIRSADEWDRVVWPDLDTNPHVLRVRDAVRLMAAACLGRVPVAAVVPSPIDLPALIMGMEPWLEAVLFDPAATQRVMKTVVPIFVGLANGLLADGAAFLVMPCAFASPAIVTRDITSRFARPVLDEALSQVKGPVIIHHIGAPILSHLDLLKGLPSTVGFALDHRDHLGQARQVVGPDPVLLGGPFGPNLARIGAAQVERECEVILEDRRRDPRFVLFTSGADVPLNTPPENIHAMRRAAESFGTGEA